MVLFLQDPVLLSGNTVKPPLHVTATVFQPGRQKKIH